MSKKILMLIMSWLIFAGPAWAQSWEIDLSAGAHSATGGVHYRQFVDTGFFKLGASGIYGEDDDDAYRLGTVNFLVGSDTLSPGLIIELGLKGIYGIVEKGSNEGDIGAVGFAGHMEYLFSRDLIPIPLEVFGAVIYAPEILSFLDSEDYLEFNIGTGIRIGRYASARLSYANYHIKLTSGASPWRFNDGCFRLGLVLRF